MDYEYNVEVDDVIDVDKTMIADWIWFCDRIICVRCGVNYTYAVERPGHESPRHECCDKYVGCYVDRCWLCCLLYEIAWNV